MPPKIKVTKEDIINAAVEVVQKYGAQAINARTVATVLDCSTQPIFSNFDSMDELRLAVIERADLLCNEYIKREAQSGKFPTYKASGMAYIRFAKEEKELFKLLYMRDRKDEVIPESSELGEEMESVVRGNTGLNKDDARLFHLEMWAFVHGIATMVATGFFDIDPELVSRMLTDAYQGMKKQYNVE